MALLGLFLAAAVQAAPRTGRIHRPVAAPGDSAGATVTQVVRDAVGMEAALTGPALVAERERLQAQVEALEAQVRDLTVSLAEARFEGDRLRMQGERLPAERGAPAGALNGPDAVVMDVNRELGLVVLDGGLAAGLRPGLTLGLVRDDQVVARVRTVDVRERITGALIEALTTDAYPEPGDRAVIWRATRR